jgi:hypothetical protein
VCARSSDFRTPASQPEMRELIPTCASKSNARNSAGSSLQSGQGAASAAPVGIGKQAFPALGRQLQMWSCPDERGNLA